LLPSLSRNVRIVTLSRLIVSSGFSATIPFLAIYLAVERATPLELVGFMYLLQGAASLCSQILSGLLSDHLGPKRTLLIGYVFSAVGAIYMAVLVAGNYSPLLIILTYPIFSLLRGVSIPAGATLIADDNTDLIGNFSLLVMASNLGFALGPAIGGIIVATTGYALLFLMSSALTFTSLILSLFLTEGKYHLMKEKASPRPDVYTFGFIILTLLGFIVIGQDIEPFALYSGQFLHVSNLTIGLLFAFSGLLIVVLQLPVMRLLRKYGSYKLLIASSLVAFTAFVILYLSANEMELFLAMGTITLAEILFVVPSQIWVTLRSPSTRKGAYQGYYSAVRTAGRSMGAWLGSTAQGLFLTEPSYSWVAMMVLALAFGAGYGIHANKISSVRDPESDLAVDMSN
jgi:predicted MFS family arabinose efflux permease